MPKPVVAIIGRQNVGKSTLLNRLAGRQISIVEDLPGTTRDRIFAGVAWQGLDFTLVDTGGLEMRPETAISRGVGEQVRTAIFDADAIIFVVDSRDGLVPEDLEIADMLRRTGKPVVIAANKADNPRLEAGAAEFYRLGMGEPVVLSAYHGRGSAELLDRITAVLPREEAPAEAPGGLKLAIVGRPNVGKSTLLNAMVGQERAIVDSAPGTTRDAVDTTVDFQGQNVLLIDTGGIRRPGRLGGVEKYSVIRALRAIDRADVVALLLDATELVTAQDAHIAGYIQRAEKGIVLVVSKWDLATGDEALYEPAIRRELKFLPYATILYTSGKMGQGVDRVIPRALDVYREGAKQVPPGEISDVVREAVAAHGPPRRGTKRLMVKSVTQTGTRPPTFVIKVNDAKLVHFSYRRYLENRLRAAFGFAGNPLRIVFKSKEGK